MTSLRIDWKWPVGFLLFVILFVPPRRYAIPAGLPFELDPYRLVVALLIVVWLLAALSDPELRLRKSGLEGPLVIFALGVVGSIGSNPARVASYETDVVKQLSVLIGYFLVFYLLINVLRTREACESAVMVLVVGCSVLAVLAVIEQKTGWSPFTHMERYLPFVEPSGLDVKAAGEAIGEGRGNRAFGSAEHPIALGAMLAMLAPVAAALAVTRRRKIWMVCLALLVVGSFGTLSRTPVLMMLAWGPMMMLLRWRDMKRFVPLAVAALAVIHLVMPGTLGVLRSSLNVTAIIQEQSGQPQSRLASGRIADLGPSLEEFSQKPVFGSGFGTRITTGPRANARLLDDQWLGTMLDTGLVGLIGLAWLMLRFVTRTAFASLRLGADGVLVAALASAVLAYAIGMFTYDALAFTQVTLVLFILLAVGSALVLASDPVLDTAEEPRWSGAPSPAPAARTG